MLMIWVVHRSRWDGVGMKSWEVDLRLDALNFMHSLHAQNELLSYRS